MARGRAGKRRSRTEVDESDENGAQTAQNQKDRPKDERGPPNKKLKRDKYRKNAATSAPGGVAELPRKKFYRQRAHANPFSDHRLTYPAAPEHMNWAEHFPAFADHSATTRTADGVEVTPLVKPVEVLDIGCGFGGLLFSLAPRMPQTLILGLEIRYSVTEYVAHKIRALRAHQAALAAGQPVPPQPQKFDLEYPTALVDGQFANTSVLRANTMKFLPNFFKRGTITRLFLCFPDPHFKARKHKQRIVSGTLVAEYAFVLRPGGLVLSITDVEDLAEWMAKHFDASPSFERVAEEDVVAMGEGVVEAMRRDTEEGRKVDRNKGLKFTRFWRRLADPPWPGEEDAEGGS